MMDDIRALLSPTIRDIYDADRTDIKTAERTRQDAAGGTRERMQDQHDNFGDGEFRGSGNESQDDRATDVQSQNDPHTDTDKTPENDVDLDTDSIPDGEEETAGSDDTNGTQDASQDGDHDPDNDGPPPDARFVQTDQGLPAGSGKSGTGQEDKQQRQDDDDPGSGDDSDRQDQTRAGSDTELDPPPASPDHGDTVPQPDPADRKPIFPPLVAARLRSSWATIRQRIWSRTTTVVVSILAALMVLGLGIWSLVFTDDDLATSRVAAPPAQIDTTLGGDIQARFPDYQGALEESNDQGASRAAESGRSFVPAPEEVPINIDLTLSPDETGSGVHLTPNATMTAGTTDSLSPGDPEFPDPLTPVWDITRDRSQLGPIGGGHIIDRGNPFDAPVATVIPPENPMIEYLAALAARPHPRMGSQRFEPSRTPGGIDASGRPLPELFPANHSTTSFATVPNADRDLFQSLGLLPGDLFDARMITSLNSDLPGPAIAEIIQSPLTGARVTGIFQPQFDAGGLSLRFDSLTLPGGQRFAIAGYGLSPWTGESLTRSRLNRRLMSRIGVPALIGLLSGAASAITAVPAQKVVVSGDNVIVERDESGERGLIAAGIAGAAAATGQVLAGTTPGNPQILLAAGSPIVLLLAPTTEVAATASAPPPSVPLPPSLPALPGPAGAAASVLLPALLGELPPQDIPPRVPDESLLLRRSNP
ncbi:MAG: hypothetical protein OXD33_06650 [Rhodobacteraceae bacterium]|nr:hypothetical protein [Paracoccaceae bacterium]